MGLLCVKQRERWGCLFGYAGGGGGGGGGIITPEAKWSKRKDSRSGGLFDKYKIAHGCRTKLVKDSAGKWVSKYGDKIIAWDIAPDPEYFKELFRVSKHQIIWGGNYFDLPPSRNFIVWRKKGMPENFSMAMAEYAWTNISGNAKVFEYRTQDPERFHPTQKPVALYKWLLFKYAKQGDKILDTHFGSGSIAVACNEMGFNLVASEIDNDYFNAACARIKLDAAQLKFNF
ncbi:MAG: site-specific DNA-methyltransferase [Treponema sp.]|nr:site-specific DNA-methyltransferase [Treponema sp.]